MNSSKFLPKKKTDFVSITIYSVLTIIVIFIESIYVLINGLRDGFLRKEVLSKESDLGFDIDIIIKQ